MGEGRKVQGRQEPGLTTCRLAELRGEELAGAEGAGTLQWRLRLKREKSSSGRGRDGREMTHTKKKWERHPHRVAFLRINHL